jgi:hypothetical protein
MEDMLEYFSARLASEVYHWLSLRLENCVIARRLQEESMAWMVRSIVTKI